MLVVTILAALGSVQLEAAGSAKPRHSSAPRHAIVHRAGGSAKDRPPIHIRSSYIGHDAGEPTIGVTDQSHVFVAATEGAAVGGGFVRTDIMRSTDRGVTWDEATPKIAGEPTHSTTGDPYVFVDDSGRGSRVFTIDLQGYACSFISFSDDEGESWEMNPFGCGRPVNDHQTLFSAPPITSSTVGYPNIVYYCFQDFISSSCTKSLDGGRNFIPAGTLSFESADAEAGEICGGLHGHGFGDRRGFIYIPKVHCGLPLLAVSRDEGATWERYRIAKLRGAGHEASVAVDRAGNIYFAYISEALLPYLVVSRDDGKTWGEPMMVASPGVVQASLPSIAVNEQGELVIAYMGSENPDPNHSYRQTWNGYLTRTSDALARRPMFVSAQTNPDRDPLLRGDCPQIKCGPVYDFIDVVVDSRGTAWSVMVDGCLEVCARTNTGNDGAAGFVTMWRDG